MALEWFVVQTESSAEYLAADQLGRDGFEVFFPRIKTVCPRTGHVDTPLFPGYLFLRCDPSNQRWLFRPAHRVVGWVRFGGELPSLPDEVMSEIKSRLAVINSEGGLWNRFRPGEQVRIVSNSLEGYAKVIEGAKSPGARVKVLIEFMGTLVSAQVPWESIRSVNEDETTVRIPRRTRGKGRWIGGFEPRALATSS